MTLYTGSKPLYVIDPNANAPTPREWRRIHLYLARQWGHYWGPWYMRLYITVRVWFDERIGQ